MEEKKNQVAGLAEQLLKKKQPATLESVAGITYLAGDGSQRTFHRLHLNDGSAMVAVMPNEESPLGLQEALSSWQICRHLHSTGIPVPDPVAYDSETGLILFEDLGDLRLHDLLCREEDLGEGRRFSIYREVVHELVCMQLKGREGFDTSWCWQTPRYDRQLMLERESGYFQQALCHDYFNLAIDTGSLLAEFIRIADRASRAPADFFLHRDFQSRNIMIKEGKIRIIDFQGGRLGPLGYDLASLLIDPYVTISPQLQESLLDEYIRELLKKEKYDSLAFRSEYLYLAMQRNLQILGAFAFLGKQRGKSFFLTFIRPALESMQGLLTKVKDDRYPILAGVIEICLEKIGEKDIA